MPRNNDVLVIRKNTISRKRNKKNSHLSSVMQNVLNGERLTEVELQFDLISRQENYQLLNCRPQICYDEDFGKL